MISTATTFLLLAAISLQGVYGGLRESVVISLGGGHESPHAEVADTARHECGHSENEHHHHHHHHEEHDHHHNTDGLDLCHEHSKDCCEGTEIELDLVLLISNPRGKDNHTKLLTTIAAFSYSTDLQSFQSRYQDPPLCRGLDPGISQRLAVVRSTRLLL
ncbi:MAG: hypothetical protein P8M22_11965 [Phycisphaerales bacterium]|nr:hypothetical protein [Phycisphaerales bacterium]